MDDTRLNALARSLAAPAPRRALVAATAALAAAPVVEAKKKGKGKKKKPPAPLAYAVARVTQLGSTPDGVVQIDFTAQILHVASGKISGLAGSTAGVPFATAGTALVAEIRANAARALSIGYELSVPEDRIAVTLL